jgi:hypothetical protein
MTAFPPGPWRARYSTPGVIHVEGPPQPIVFVIAALDIDFDGYVERTSNATLVAAAPDLHAACQALVAGRTEEAEALAIKALMKARGDA